MATPNPLSGVFAAASPASKKTFHIAGIVVDVFGLDELPDNATDVSCLWLLHPRLSKKTRMEPVAHASIAAWNEKVRRGSAGSPPRGLIAVSFDQRNHGTRLVDKLSNEAWSNGNPSHAQDMFSIFQGTAMDMSQLIDYLPGYLFPDDKRRFVRHMVLGVSLGAHAAWHCILRDERVMGAVIVVGCADYLRLMRLRAEQTKLQSWTSTSPPGASFVGSPDFPAALVDMIKEWDPTGVLIGDLATNGAPRDPTGEELKTLKPLMQSRLEGKRVLNLAGADDALVPHSCSVPFVNWLSRAIAPGGWFEGHGVSLVDKVFSGVGHQFSSDMQKDALAFIMEEASRPNSRASKM